MKSSRRRWVLEVPMEELLTHFARNQRQDVKLVVPKLMDAALRTKLIRRGKIANPEGLLKEPRWTHTTSLAPTRTCRSSDFIGGELESGHQAPFALAFANEHADQGEHYHKKHIEIYYSESPIFAEYRHFEHSESYEATLSNGGAIVFAPLVVHKVTLSGITLVVECPSVEDDRFDGKVHVG